MKKFKKRITTAALAACLIFQSSMTVFGAEVSPEPIADSEPMQEPEVLEENLESEVLSEETEVLSDEVEILQEETESLEIPEEGKMRLQELTAGKAVLALVYLTDSYEVMGSPQESGSVVASVESGQTVQLLDAVISEDGRLWYETGFYVDDNYCQGYIERDYLATSDEELLEWEENYLPNPGEDLVRAAGNQDIESFPDSYRAALSALKSRHPNWTFVKMNTNLDWNTVVKNELGERSLVQSSSNELWKNGSYSSGWSYASEGILKYFLDPRNYLTEDYIFALELLTYNSSYHTREAVQNILNSTFMSGRIPDSDKTYAQAFYEIGSSLKVSPFHLACRVYQEQGRGTSALISGTYAGYEGYYNYFNIGASGNTDKKVIESGLTYARDKGWDTRYKSLLGGAEAISENYILKGQDTLYLQKFDVDASYSGLYWHQYQQNIQAPASECQGIRRSYISTNALENPFVFKIPVYNNMPGTACPQPGTEPELPADCPFSDVEINPGSWKYESIKYVYGKGIMNGISGTTRFAPDEPLTRAMFATVLYRMAGEPPVAFKNRFTDVQSGQYYSSAVIWAYQKGIVNGYPDGRYGINDNITREQIAKMLMEYAKVQKYATNDRASLDSFPDKASVSAWGIEYMQWAVGCGMINGRNNNGTNYLEPKGNATRAECAAMLMRFQNKYQ